MVGRSSEAHGLNRGVLASRGRIIKLVTDDDYFYADAMRYAISVMEGHPELDAMQCGGEAFRYDPATQEASLDFYEYLPPSVRLAAGVTAIFDNVQCGLGLFLTRNVITRVGLFDTSFRAVDTDYMGRLIRSKVNFRYLNIKLYRHISYPHSGERLEDECTRDRMRVLLANKQWDELLDNRLYPPATLGGLLGIPSQPCDVAFLELLWHFDRMRRSRRWARLLPFLVSCVSGLQQCRRRWRRFAGPPFPAEQQLPHEALVQEPQWDGELR